MALSFVSYASNSMANNAGPLVVAAPAGIQDNDILIATLVNLSNATWGDLTAYPAGFTEIDNDGIHGAGIIPVRAVWKRASSESGSYSFTFAKNTYANAQISVIRGASQAVNPPFTQGVFVSPGSLVTSTDPPSVDPLSSGDRLALVYAYSYYIRTFTQSSGYTLRVNASGSVVMTLGVFTKLYTGQVEDPGVATVPTSSYLGSNTLIFEPSAVAPVTSLNNNMLSGVC